MRLLADENMVGLEALPPEIEVVQAPGREIDAAAVRDFDALWVRSVTPVNAALVDGSRLRFVGSATAGLEHVDVAALKARGVAFAAAPGSNAMAVVEYVISALLAMAQPWERLCAGGTLGIVGYGHIGRRLAAFARAMGWELRLCDPWVAAESSAAENFESLESVLGCDVVSLHSSLHSRQPWPSRHLLGAAELAWMSWDQWLVNACRGAVVDNEALLACVESGASPQLILDVWEGEPEIDWRLLQSPAVHIASPHIAGYSWDAKWEAVRLLLAATRAAGLVDSAAVSLKAPEVEGLPPAWPEKASPAALMHSVYDPRRDDQRLRELLEVPGEARPAGFDRLRRKYPLRREVSALLRERGWSEGGCGKGGEPALGGEEAHRLVTALRAARATAS
ncbi:MAG: 4-phosphoerythronate dehydrogenase [Pseudomonadota bacterium]